MKNKRKIINKYLSRYKSSILSPFRFEGIDWVFYVNENNESIYMWDSTYDLYAVVNENYKEYTLKQFTKYCARMLTLKAFW